MTCSLPIMSSVKLNRCGCPPPSYEAHSRNFINVCWGPAQSSSVERAPHEGVQWESSHAEVDDLDVLDLDDVPLAVYTM